jgi:DNA methylase/ParB-like nuclease family protein
MHKHHSSVVGQRIAITYRAVTSLVPDPANPRRHTKKQIEKIARSIEEFGFNVPILIDATLKVIAGHGRLLACVALGWSEVPTIQLDHLSASQARAFMVADNRLGELSTWDDALLAQQLGELSMVDLDFNIEATGFEIAEIDLRIGGREAEPELDDLGDLIPPPVGGPPISKPGDLWALGQHRILCGNALEIGCYHTLLGDDRAAIVFNDMPVDGYAGGLGAIHHRPFTPAEPKTDQTAFTAFLAAAWQNAAEFSHAGSIHFLCMDWRHIGEVLAAASGVYGDPQDLCVWAKQNPSRGSPYRSQHELVFVFKNGRAPHRDNGRLGRFGRNRSNLWQYPASDSLSRSSAEGNSLQLHPTAKPVAMVADAILDCSARRDIVLSGFLGNGTTLIAAERTGRRCFGLELDPANVDTTLKRWQKLTGKTARHALTGAPFAEPTLDEELRHVA